MSKSILIGVIKKTVPGTHEDVAREIVEAVLEVVSDRLVECGRFDLGKVGVLTVKQRMSGGAQVDQDAVESDLDESGALASSLHDSDLLVAAVERSAPDLPAGVPAEIVENLLLEVVEELLSQGSFNLQKVGSLTLEHAGQVADATTKADAPSRGISARYRISSFLRNRLRASFVSRSKGSLV